jgi:hypothetical protein
MNPVGLRCIYWYTDEAIACVAEGLLPHWNKLRPLAIVPPLERPDVANTAARGFLGTMDLRFGDPRIGNQRENMNVEA